MLAMAINDDIACNTQLLSKVHISNPVSLILPISIIIVRKNNKHTHTLIDYILCVCVCGVGVVLQSYFHQLYLTGSYFDKRRWSCVGMEQQQKT